jgi:hypothetical protein
MITTLQVGDLLEVLWTELSWTCWDGIRVPQGAIGEVKADPTWGTLYVEWDTMAVTPASPWLLQDNRVRVVR